MLKTYPSTLYQDKRIVIDKAYRDQEWLTEQYKKLSVKEIAKKCGCSDHTIYDYLHKYDIVPIKKPRTLLCSNKEWLTERYKKMGPTKIAKKCGCNRNTVTRYLDKYSIPFIHTNKRNMLCRNKEWLTEQYYSKILDRKEISRLSGCGEDLVKQCFKKFDISQKNRMLYRNENGEKLCRKCRQWKNERGFSRDKRKVDGLSIVCKKCAKINAKKYHNERHKKDREKRKKIKMMVFSHYSKGKPKCVLCGCDIFNVLTIDHIEGGGGKHREKNNIDAGFPTYQWLIRNGYPKGFRLLCRNCNWLEYMRLNNNISLL